MNKDIVNSDICLIESEKETSISHSEENKSQAALVNGDVKSYQDLSFVTSSKSDCSNTSQSNGIHSERNSIDPSQSSGYISQTILETDSPDHETNGKSTIDLPRTG